MASTAHQGARTLPYWVSAAGCRLACRRDAPFAHASTQLDPVGLDPPVCLGIGVPDAVQFLLSRLRSLVRARSSLDLTAGAERPSIRVSSMAEKP